MELILKILGILMIVGSILLGLYVGCYVMFYGGIVQIINSINPLNGIGIAGGICRIVFCEIAGLIPIIFVPIGAEIIYKSEDL